MGVGGGSGAALLGTTGQMEEIQRCYIKQSYWENCLEGEASAFIKKKIKNWEEGVAGKLCTGHKYTRFLIYNSLWYKLNIHIYL